MNYYAVHLSPNLDLYNLILVTSSYLSYHNCKRGDHIYEKIEQPLIMKMMEHAMLVPIKQPKFVKSAWHEC